MAYDGNRCKARGCKNGHLVFRFRVPEVRGDRGHLECDQCGTWSAEGMTRWKSPRPSGAFGDGGHPDDYGDR